MFAANTDKKKLTGGILFACVIYLVKLCENHDSIVNPKSVFSTLSSFDILIYE